MSPLRTPSSSTPSVSPALHAMVQTRKMSLRFTVAPVSGQRIAQLPATTMRN